MIKFLLDYSSGIPIYRQIIDQIRFGIASDKVHIVDLKTLLLLCVQKRSYETINE